MLILLGKSLLEIQSISTNLIYSRILFERRSAVFSQAHILQYSITILAPPPNIFLLSPHQQQSLELVCWKEKIRYPSSISEKFTEKILSPIEQIVHHFFKIMMKSFKILSNQRSYFGQWIVLFAKIYFIRQMKLQDRGSLQCLVIFLSVCFGIGSQNVAIPVIVPSHFNSALGTALLFVVDLNFRKSLLHTLSQFDSSPASGQYSIPIFLDISRYIQFFQTQLHLSYIISFIYSRYIMNHGFSYSFKILEETLHLIQQVSLVSMSRTNHIVFLIFCLISSSLLVASARLPDHTMLSLSPSTTLTSIRLVELAASIRPTLLPGKACCKMFFNLLAGPLKPQLPQYSTSIFLFIRQCYKSRISNKYYTVILTTLGPINKLHYASVFVIYLCQVVLLRS